MKTKIQKRAEARKNAEEEKSKRKTVRNMKTGISPLESTKKGKSTVPQSKRKK